MKKKGFIGLAVVLVIGLFLVIGSQFMFGTDSAVLSEQEVNEIVSSRFSGDIVSTELTRVNGQELYQIRLEEETGIYSLFVDAYTGEIGQLTHDEDTHEADESEELISEAQAEEIVRNDTDDDIESVTFNEERTLYQVVVVEDDDDRRMYDVDATTGRIERETDIEPEEDDTSENTGRITQAEAQELALEAFNGTITDIELDEEDGLLVYEIELETAEQEATVVINAYTGDVVSLSVEAQDD